MDGIDGIDIPPPLMLPPGPPPKPRLEAVAGLTMPAPPSAETTTDITGRTNCSAMNSAIIRVTVFLNTSPSDWKLILPLFSMPSKASAAVVWIEDSAVLSGAVHNSLALRISSPWAFSRSFCSIATRRPSLS